MADSCEPPPLVAQAAPVTPARAEDFAIDLQHLLSVKDAEGEPIAHVVLYPRHGALWLTDVWVGAAYRRRGLGARLLRMAVEQFGDQPIYLQIRAYTDQPLSDARLRAWYGSFGFVETAVPGVLMRPASG